MKGRVLTIAGSDSGGGAGIQADIKTITALGGYAASAITSITVQNTLGVRHVHPLPADLVVWQAEAVLDDIGADVIKTGMLGGSSVVEAVAGLLAARGTPLVLDPVMIAKDGSSLLDSDAVDALRRALLPLSALVTPNAPEASALTGLVVETEADQRRCGQRLLQSGCGAALMKGGHLKGERVVDYLVTPQGEIRFESQRIHTRNTHGTGCTLASACAVRLALGDALDAAVERARDYVHKAILLAPGFGSGAGPLDHAWPVR